MLWGSATNSQLSWSRNKIHTTYCSYWLHGRYWSVRTLRQNLCDFILHSSMFLKAPAVQEAFLSAAEAFLEQKKVS